MTPTAFVAQSKDRLEHALSSYLPAPTDELTEAMSYCALNGGKRVRASLIYAMQSSLGLDDETTDAIACAIECIHAASLVHDDLPAMDDDDWRRHRHACHIKYNEATAILCGDALMMLGINIITNIEDIEPFVVVQLCRVLTGTISASGIIGGQSHDMALTKESTLEEFEDIYLRKTCLLLGVGMELMAIAAKQFHMVQPIRQLMFHIGFGYQIQDDILDVESSTSVTGKPQYSDQKSNKITVVDVVGIDKAKTLVSEHFSCATGMLYEYFDSFTELRDLLESLLIREF